MAIDHSGTGLNTAAEIEPCQWCGEDHGPKCPHVKAMEFDADGNLTRIEFLLPNDYPRSLAGMIPDVGDDYPKLKGDA